VATGIPARLSAAEGRRFGLTVGAAFVGLGAVAWWRGHVLSAGIMAGVGLVLLIAALLVPGRLGLVYRLWMGLAAVISKVTTPVFMGIVYFVVVTPTGLVRRLAGKDSLVRPRTAKSFWIARAADAQQRTSMERQF
jgi:Saxitoxin biosynthesis operon protein SxtJ